MGVYPSQYSKVNFLEKFLKKNNVSEIIINKFIDLPEKVLKNDHEYDLYINVVFCNVGDTSYSFELNYYSEDLVEYLFNSKVFNSIGISINYLLCELIGKGYLNDEEYRK